MRFDSLDGWLHWQEQLHPTEIELGLDRVREVLFSLGLGSPAAPVITVAGTNGKGSTVAYLESILSEAGYRVGAYSSPHLLRYNERIRIGRAEVNDRDLCAAFDAVDRARGKTSLTYFEFGTLAALWLFHRQEVEILVLEVGLGGRLDAVNVLDPKVAILTSIGIDHSNWLGSDREEIGREKAGIFRSASPAICADIDPPDSVLARAMALGTDLSLIGEDFKYQVEGKIWNWESKGLKYSELPLPLMAGEHQLRNASAALRALNLLADELTVTRDHVVAGLQIATLPGRLQCMGEGPQYILDVAHNEQAISYLCQVLANTPCMGSTHVILGLLADKDANQVIAQLVPVADHWCFVGLPTERAMDVDRLHEALGLLGQKGETFAGVEQALAATVARVSTQDRILITGSFFTVAEGMRVLSSNGVDEFK